MAVVNRPVHLDHTMVRPMMGQRAPSQNRPAVAPRVRLADMVPGFLRTGVGLGFLASAIVTMIVLFGLGGWRYYWAPEDVRAYTQLHSLLRPSGPVGNILGLAGVFFMLIMHLYTLRKRFPRADWLGRPTLWLEFHIFCGIFGPALITLHTSLKFNGLISVAYWSMVIVVLSGFVGRYLYVRIPRSIRGRELTLNELSSRVAVLKPSIEEPELPDKVRDRIDAFEVMTTHFGAGDTTWTGLFFGEIGLRIKVFRLTRAIRTHRRDSLALRETLSLLSQRAFLVRRVAYLNKTKRVFDLWRVYHKPLAILMALIVVLHIATIWYLGYALNFGWKG